MKPIELNQTFLLVLLISPLIGMTGAAVMTGINAWTGAPLSSWENLTQTTSAFIGAASSGAVLSGCFGHLRRRGYLFAALGGVVATSLGAFLGAATYFSAFEGYSVGSILSDALIAAIIIPIMTASSPPSAAAWLIGMLAAHVAAKGLRNRLQR